MADQSVTILNEDTPSKPPHLEVILPHRQLLRSIDSYVESGSDADFTTDDEAHGARRSIVGDHDEDDEDAGGILGISISQAQDHMKSPKTPAAEKVRALEDSKSYFPDESHEHEIMGEPLSYESSGGGKASHSKSSSQEGRTPAADSQSPTLTESSKQSSSDHHRKRSSIIGSLFGSHDSSTRPRSSSGPIMFGSLRKILPEIATSSVQRTSTPLAMVEQAEQMQSDRAQDEAEQKQRHSTDLSNTESRTSAHDFDGANESKIASPQQKPMLIRRTTSDQSLYLRRTATGASHFDDTSPFADRSDQINSRLKAIQDTLADSSLRLPRPTINFSARPSTPERSTSNLTKRNTELNSGKAVTEIDAVDSDTKHRKHPILTEALHKVTGDVVIMGGYRGSILREADAPNRQLWAPIKIGLNIRKADLEVGLTREDELKMEEKIIPDGTLSHIGPIDISRRLINRCKKCHNSKMHKLRVHDWGYDWRLSPDLIASKLIKYLESLECNRPGNKAEKKGALVIAHSLGGVITRHVVNKRPELFSGVIYAGVPQHCVNILGPLRNGDDVLLSSKVLTAQVNFTLRTSYALLPETGRCFINQDTGERYNVDFFDVKTWDKYRLSPCINPPIPYNAKAPRKSLVGSITESISSYTPSLPTKRSSWFGGSSNNGESSTRHDAKERVEDTRQEMTNAAKQVFGNDDGVGRSLEPSMKNDSQQNRPSIATACTIPKDEAYQYLDRTLKEIRDFKSKLVFREELQEQNEYPPHAIIYGRHTPTVYGAKVANREAIKLTTAYDNLAFASGDGVVLASAAQLPSGYRCVKGGRIESEKGHVSLLGDLEGIGRCINAVLEARAKGVGMGCHDEKRRKSQA